MGVSTLLMKALRVFVYVSIGVDLTDCVFDFRMVHQLAQHDATRKQAAWLGVCTTIALALELVKHKLRQRMENDTVVAKYDRERTVRNRTQLTEEQKRITDFYPTAYDAENTQVSFDMHEDRHRANYIICIGCLELTIFYVEDATTLFVWWQTGVYNNADRLAQANLATTIISSAVALLALVYGLFKVYNISGGSCLPSTLFFSVALFTGAGCLIFWAWFALAVIGKGDEYNCIGECAVSTESLYNTTNNSLIFLHGEAEAEEQDGSEFFNNSNISNSNSSTGGAGLNKAVVGMYVVGWIVAVLGGGVVTLSTFADGTVDF